jgi:hypothetical protein
MDGICIVAARRTLTLRPAAAAGEPVPLAARLARHRVVLGRRLAGGAVCRARCGHRASTRYNALHTRFVYTVNSCVPFNTLLYTTSISIKILKIKDI